MDQKTPCNETFIRLGDKDIAATAALEQLCFSMPWSEAQFALAFKQKNFAAFGLISSNPAKCDAGLAAYISFYHAVDELEILNIAVHPDRRRQGLGHTLLSTALQAGRKMGMKRAVLEVRMHNIPALRLYEGLGFECVGRRPKYYADTGEDALVYMLSL